MNKWIKYQGKKYYVNKSKIEIGDYYFSWEINYSSKPKRRWILYNRTTNINGKHPRKVINKNNEQIR